MKIKEILKNRKTYFEVLNTYKYNPDSLDYETWISITKIEEMFNDSKVLQYSNNQVLILKYFIKDNKTIEEIADEMHITPRHVSRLKEKAIETMDVILHFSPRLTRKR